MRRALAFAVELAEPCAAPSHLRSSSLTPAPSLTRSSRCDVVPPQYHEVCVKVTDKFLGNSANQDANPLPVSNGGHWCICAWAFASAVQRDPQHQEGLKLECDKTNGKLREVYKSYISSDQPLVSPSGKEYEAKAALDTVDKLC